VFGQGGNAHKAAEYGFYSLAVWALRSCRVRSRASQVPPPRHLRCEAEEQLPNTILYSLRVEQKHENQSYQ